MELNKYNYLFSLSFVPYFCISDFISLFDLADESFAFIISENHLTSLLLDDQDVS